MYHAPGIQPARASKGSLNALTSAHHSITNGDPALKPTSRIPLREVGSRQNFIDTQSKRIGLVPKESLKPAIKRISVVSNPQICSEYSSEILNTLRENETALWSSAKIFENQTNLTPKMRATLIDWLVDVQKRENAYRHAFLCC